MRVAQVVAQASCICLVAARTSAAQEAPQFILAWGTFGTGPGAFNEPRGIALDGSGNVYVTDFGNNRIQKFGPSGAFLTQWGSTGSADGQFNGPVAIAVAADGFVYVTETENQMVIQNRVQKFDSDGTFVTKWGTAGAGPGEFNSPYGIAVAPQGNVYVADTGNHRIQVFTPGGVLLFTWGTYGSALGQFGDPFGVAIDNAGHVYVTERGRLGEARLQKFTLGGEFVTAWGSHGNSEPGQFIYPFGVAVDGGGSVYVADREAGQSPYQVQKFTDGGTFLDRWGILGPGQGSGSPWGVAAGQDVFVVDSHNHRIQKFGYLPTPAARETWGAVKSRYRPGATAAPQDK